MDFVVSKVAMSICALLTATVLARSYAHSSQGSTAEDLEAALRSFCDLARACIRSGAETACTWTAPELSNGGELVFVLSCRYLKVSASGQTEFAFSPEPVHLWTWTGECLNASIVESLDDQTLDIEVRSGGDITLSSKWVMTEGGEELMLFASRAG